jgi:hypothetical protein
MLREKDVSVLLSSGHKGVGLGQAPFFSYLHFHSPWPAVISVQWRDARAELKLKYDLLPFESVPSYRQEGRLLVSRFAFKYLLVTAFVSGIIAVIWSGHISDHIRHVDYVPLPITAPAR